jgi:hypothetical protein
MIRKVPENKVVSLDERAKDGCWLHKTANLTSFRLKLIPLVRGVCSPRFSGYTSDNMSRQQATPAAILSAFMNKDQLIERRTESSALDESVAAQIAQISRLDQERVIKTVIKYFSIQKVAL